MNELVKALKNFIVRDIIYIIGGASVIITFLYLFGKIDTIRKETPTVIYLFIAGISYVIGYCIQELFSFLHIVTTASYFKPCAVQKWLYHCLTLSKWKEIALNENQLDEAELLIQEKACTDTKADRERIISLMMVGTTMGPCTFVSGILLVIGAIAINLNFCCRPTRVTVNTCFDLKLGITFLLASLLLIILGWIKGMQLMKNTEQLYNRLRENQLPEYG